LSGLSPVSQNQRTAIIDILRGWALLSVVLMNYISIYQWNNHFEKLKAGPVSRILENSADVIFSSKGWTLLAILFGYGFSALMNKLSRIGQNKYSFFITRMLWLFVIAFFNTLFFGGDILNDYALMGLILLFFNNCSQRQLFIIGLCVLLVTPLLQAYLGRLHVLFSPSDRDRFYQLYHENNLPAHIKANLFMRYKWMLRLSYLIILHLVQLGCFLIGAALERSNSFEANGLLSKTSVIRKIFWLSLPVSVFLYFLSLFSDEYAWTFALYYDLYYPQILSIMVCTSISIVWLYKAKLVQRFLALLQVLGRMTLTNYLLQNMIAFFLFILINPRWQLPWYMLTAAIVFILQVFFSAWWLSRFNYGFFEWLWRCLSYRQWLPLKKAKPIASTT
jgi:uncharacterized protein